MATVYLAQDLKHDRKVAVKVLRPELSAVIGGARFLTEIRTTANLQHPHILPLHDSGEVDGTVFYVMPFVDGESLRDRLTREKQLPIDDALRIATEVADALHYAHGHGVIHRDIKPENILLQGGHALVADFGIALAASTTGGGRMTETGMSLGTPTYMSPEQAMGEREITARSDVYALGCVLYEMLLGEPPFTGPTAQSIVAKVLSERPAPMRVRRDRIAPAVEAAVFRALERLPADRFGTLAEFSAALAGPMPATGNYAPAAALKSGVDRRLVFAAGLLGGLVLGFAAFRSRAPAAVSVSATSTQLTFNGRSHLPAISPDGEFVAFVEQACPLYQEVACPQRLIVQERANARPVEVLHDVFISGAPRWTADGLSIVVSARLDPLREGLFVVPRLGGVPRSLGESGVFDTHATADSVIVVRRRGPEQLARIISITTGEGRDTIPLGARTVGAVGWSPDGRLLAIGASFNSIVLVRRDGSVSDSVVGAYRPMVRWTPDGRGLLAFRALPVKEDDLDRLEVDSRGGLGARTVVLQRVSAVARGEFDLARRIGRLAFLSGVLNLDLWTFELPPAQPEARQQTTGTTWYAVPAIAPDGERLYYQRGDARGDNLYQLTLPDREEALRDDQLPGGFKNVVVSRDHRRVIFSQIDSTGMVMLELDVASRRTSSIPWTDSDWAPMPAGARGFVYYPRDGRTLMVLDSMGAAARPIALPDSMRVLSASLAPDGSAVAVIVVTGNATVLGITSLSAWGFRVLHRFLPGEKPALAGFTDEGWMHVATARGVDGSVILSRLRIDQPRLTELLVLPPGCQLTSASIATAAPRGACRSSDVRGDIWLADLPGITR